MNFLNKIFHNCAYGAIAAASLFVATGCSSDEDQLIEKYYDFEAKIEVHFHDDFTAFSFKGDDDLMVIPSNLTNLSYKVENNSIIHDNRDGSFTAIDLGSTIIEIYNGEELIRSIPVTVTPNSSVVLTSGQTSSISTLLPEAADVNGWYSEDKKIAEVDYKTGAIVGLKAGTTLLRARDYRISVEVKPGSLDNVFKAFDALPLAAYETQIENFMAGYDLFFSGPADFDGVTYYAMEYKPFDKAVSITFLLTNYSWSRRLKLAVIETELESSEVYEWLCNEFNANVNFSQPGYITSFRSGAYNIRPMNNSWSRLLLEN